ncbi:transposable element Tc1 transposase [Trichonephila clavipes]|nr:transposable element Tc1 transposase [Trichonephila clavipes]
MGFSWHTDHLTGTSAHAPQVSRSRILIWTQTISQDFFPPKPDGVSAHDDDVTLLPYLVLQSPCHSRRSIRKYLFPFRTLHFHQEQYTSVRGRRILPDPYPRDVNRNRRFINVTITRRLQEDFGKRNMPGKRARRHFSQLIEFEKGLIIGMKTAGWSTHRVAGQVDPTGKTPRREDRRIVWQALVDPTVTRSTIRADVGLAIVPQKISRHLAEANLKSKRPFRALPLTPEHRQLRLQWCKPRSMWNVTDWQNVVFSVESRFVLGTDDNRVRVWRHPGERYNSPHTVLCYTVRTAGVMVWGAIAYDSRSTLIEMRGTLTGQRYVDDILRP